MSHDAPGLPVQRVASDNALAPHLRRCADSGEFVMLQLENGEILWVVPRDGLAHLAAIGQSDEFKSLLKQAITDVESGSGEVLEADNRPRPE